jgi:hypothetical protein
MRSVARSSIVAVVLGVLAAGCRAPVPAGPAARPGEADLAGAWRGRVQFSSGALAAVKDLEFMYVFNAGGTMTESSNYDGAPPVPPAYGVWRRTGPGAFEAHYEFYATKAPAGFAEIVAGGGWLPAGRGVLVESITLAADGRSFISTIAYTAFDAAGKPAGGGGEGTVGAVRISF